MKIWFDFAISAIVVVSLANAKSVFHQNPVTDNQLWPDDFSLKQSSDVNLPIYHIGSVGKVTTDISQSNTLIAFTSENTTGMTFVEETLDTVSESTTSDEDTTTAQTTTKDGVTERTTSMDRMTTTIEHGSKDESNLFNPFGVSSFLRKYALYNHIVRSEDFSCQDGYTTNVNGECVPIFKDSSN
ncbi:unnamed protein product [Aphis gossypii]|uniref:Uncharacterized protein n=1 Tax=Aphis gossypii TaxID=80765 RepID=A0A9P0J966_APHGO|nr:unnamed protein product [Aphis gossypii]